MTTANDSFQFFSQGMAFLVRGTSPDQARRNFDWVVRQIDPKACDAWRALSTLDENTGASNEQVENMYESRMFFGRMLAAYAQKYDSEHRTRTEDAEHLLKSSFTLPVLDVTLKLVTRLDIQLAYAALCVGREDYDLAEEILGTISSSNTLVTPNYHLVNSALYYQTRLWDDVLRAAQPAIEAYHVSDNDKEVSSDPNLLARSLAGMMYGEALLHLGDVESGIIRLEQAGNVSGNAEAQRIAAHCLYLLGLARRHTGEDEASQKAFSASIALVPSEKVRQAMNNPDEKLHITSREMIAQRSSRWEFFTEPSLADAQEAEATADRSSMLAEAEKILDEQVGMTAVKDSIRRLKKSVRFDLAAANRGRASKAPSRHLVFTGPPGTGKTTMARVVGDIYCGLGVTRTNKVLETTRSDFIGQHEGTSAPKTRAVCQKAYGGILFIDEAYGLVQKRNAGQIDPFGTEAINELLKHIEDKRDDLVVILAGYAKDMDEFLASNEGLRSRFPQTIAFSSYSPEEIFDICSLIATNNGFEIEDAARGVVVTGVRPLLGTNAQGRRLIDVAGNGRFARNLVESAQEFHKDFLGERDDLDSLTDDVMFTLTEQDFERAMAHMLSTIIAPPALDS